MRYTDVALALCACLLVAALAAGCADASSGEERAAEIVVANTMTLNPTGATPLSALLELETAEQVTLALRVVGRNGPESDVVHAVDDPATEFDVPVLGLYPDHINTVHVTLFDTDGKELTTRTYRILTEPLGPDMPEIEVLVADGERMADGMTLVSYWGTGFDRPKVPKRPFMFDRFGDVRWLLDYVDDPVLGDLHYDAGIQRLQNGNLYFTHAGPNVIHEVDMLGRVLNRWEMPGYSFHHQVIEKPNGNFLATVNKVGADTIEDHVIEIDRQSGTIVNVWDMRESLDYDRVALTDDRHDWIHLNSVAFDERDGGLVVSGRTQGVAKLTEENEVVWILATHRGWGASGDGVDLTQYLLQPLDAAGEPIDDPAVLDGAARHDDFDWPWYQHAPIYLPNGNLLLYDNGANRHYAGGGSYSRAVEYEIDEENMTVRQVWQYGRERGPEAFSNIVSNVTYLPDERHVTMSSGAMVDAGDRFAKVIEVDYDTRDLLFEAIIRAEVTSANNITLHRTDRLPIYPQ